MATQETLPSGNQAVDQRAPSTAPRVSLVVDQPAAHGQALLLLPFATGRGDAYIGRHLGALLQRRLRQLPDLLVGQGLFLAVSAESRRYLPLPRPLSTDRALTCGAEWNASAVLFGSLSMHPALEWTITLLDTATAQVLLTETVSGAPEDLPAAVAEVAAKVAAALGFAASVLVAAAPDTSVAAALLAYLEALELRPQFGLDTAQPEAMRAALVRSLALDPLFQAPALALLGDLATSAEDGSIVTLLTHCLPGEAERTAALLPLARLALEHGYIVQAEALVAALLAARGDVPEHLALASRVAFQTRHFAQARVLAYALLDADPGSQLGHELLAEALAAEGRFVGAAYEWEYLLHCRPADARILARLGSYLYTIGEHERAYQLLLQAFQLGEVTVDTLLLLGTVAYRRSDYHEAVTALRRALLSSPTLVRAHTLLASCYRRLGDEAQALRHSAHAVVLAPEQWPTALALGYDALRGGHAMEAVMVFAYAVHTHPEVPEALQGLGLALVANGMYGDGVIALTRAHELDARNPRLLCALALAQQQQGNAFAAAQSLAAAETLVPFSKEVARTRLALKHGGHL